MKKLFGMLAVTLAGAAVACGSSDDDKNEGADAAATIGAETSGVEANVESLGASFVGSGADDDHALAVYAAGLGGTLPGARPEDAGDDAKKIFSPDGCLTVTVDAAQHSATYAFDGCRGPYGLVTLTGTVTASYVISTANSASFSFSASKFQINGATVDWSASANVTWDGTKRTMDWQGSITGTTKSGRTFDRVNTKSYAWDTSTQCLTANGSSDGTITGDELKITLKDFTICAGACPQAGSEVNVADVTTGKDYDLTYGDGNATYTGPRGAVTFDLVCR